MDIEVDPDTVASPFLPGTWIQYAWDSTSLGYLKTCPQLYQYRMIEGWQGKGDNIHLRFGIEYHSGLQDYDICKANGASHDEALQDTVRALMERTHDWRPDTDSKAVKSKNRETLMRSVVWYLDKFKDDVAETVIRDNGMPAVELSFRFELDWGPTQGILTQCPSMRSSEGSGSAQIDCEGHLNNAGHVVNGCDEPCTFVMHPELGIASQPQPYLLSGHLDRVVSYLGENYVMDRKTTTSSLGQYYFKQFEPNNQMSLYSIASQVILGSPVKGVIIDAASIKPDYTEFGRDFTYRDGDLNDEWLVDLGYWLKVAEGYATEEYWPKNDMACDKYGGCAFREVCSRSPHVRKTYLNADFIQQEPQDRWNPLKPR